MKEYHVTGNQRAEIRRRFGGDIHHRRMRRCVRRRETYRGEWDWQKWERYALSCVFARTIGGAIQNASENIRSHLRTRVGGEMSWGELFDNFE